MVEKGQGVEGMVLSLLSIKMEAGTIIVVKGRGRGRGRGFHDCGREGYNGP